MKIIIDRRERLPYAFDSYPGTETEPGALQSGDYSLAGLTDNVAVERKSLDDLVGCLAGGRERFEKELQRARGMDAFCVVVEAPWEDLAKGRFKSRMKPHAVCQSVLAFQVRYHIPFVFAGSRQAAEYVTHGALRQYLNSATRRLKAIVRAHGDAVETDARREVQ